MREKKERKKKKTPIFGSAYSCGGLMASVLSTFLYYTVVFIRFYSRTARGGACAAFSASDWSCEKSSCLGFRLGFILANDNNSLVVLDYVFSPMVFVLQLTRSSSNVYYYGNAYEIPWHARRRGFLDF